MAFQDFPPLNPDSLLALMGRCRADTRPWKMDLGVGVYRDAQGATPVFGAVKLAERLLAETQTTKSYLGSDGDPAFVSRLSTTVLPSAPASRLAGLQTVGGTGALRLAAELLAQTQPERRLWMGLPTWTNHAPIFSASRLQTTTVDLFDPTTRRYRPEALLAALEGGLEGSQLSGAQPGDAVLIHACCHNPTGVDPEAGFWEQLADVVTARKLVPVIDMAYHGLGHGWDADAMGVRTLAARIPRLLIAYSCDKNFGLYRERVGALLVQGANPGETSQLCNHANALARANYSMPPDHGAAVVRLILDDAVLTSAWRTELDGMRVRIHALRTALAARGLIGAVDLAALRGGVGMFAMLPLSIAHIDRLQSDHAVYMAPNGRINIAGLAADRIDLFVDALRTVQCKNAA